MGENSFIARHAHHPGGHIGRELSKAFSGVATYEHFHNASRGRTSTTVGTKKEGRVKPKD